MYKSFSFLLVIFTFICARKIPEFIRKCPFLEDKIELGDCIKMIFEENREIFMKGIPEMRTPVLEPFQIQKINFNIGNDSFLDVKADFENIILEGIKNVAVLRIEADFVNRVSVIDLHFPMVRITSNYTVNGRVLFVHLKGTGKVDSNFTNIRAVGRLEGELITKNNKTFIEWFNPKINVSIGGAQVYLNNLFAKNPELTRTTNQLINNNIINIINYTKPLIEETISSIIFNILKGVFKIFAVEELFEK